MTKDKYKKSINRISFFTPIYAILTLLSISLIPFLITKDNGLVLTTITYFFLLLINILIIFFVYKRNCYKYNYDDDKLYRFVTMKSRINLALLFISLTFNMFVFFGFFLFGILNIIELPYVIFTIIMFSCLILYGVFAHFYVKKMVL